MTSRAARFSICSPRWWPNPWWWRRRWRAEARYRLLATIRDYAREKLEEAGETVRLRDRHLDLFVWRAEKTAAKLIDPYQQIWFSWLDGQHDNIRAALAWALESGRIESGLRIARLTTSGYNQAANTILWACVRRFHGK